MDVRQRTIAFPLMNRYVSGRYRNPNHLEAGELKKLGIAVLAAASIAGASAQSASAAVYVPGPCERQQELFEKYNIQIDMYSPEISWAYNTVCGVTG